MRSVLRSGWPELRASIREKVREANLRKAGGQLRFDQLGRILRQKACSFEIVEEDAD